MGLVERIGQVRKVATGEARMTGHGGASPRTFRTLLAAAVTLVLALLVISVQAAPAEASGNRTVTLGLSNVRVGIDAGDSVTYVPVGGVYKIVATVTGTVRYSNPGTYTVSWSVQKVTSVLGPLGQTISKLTDVAKCTATIVVAPVVSKVTSAASKVVWQATSAVNQVVPKVHVSVSVPRVLPQPSHSSVRPGAPAPTSSAAAPAPAAGASSSGSGQTGGLTATAGGASTIAGSGAVPGVLVAGAGVAPAAGTGAGGGHAVNVAGGSRLQPVAMNQQATRSGEPATKGNADQGSAFGSARFPVLLAILAVVALVGVIIGYVRAYVFGRMI
jgi:hypothetical protein